MSSQLEFIMQLYMMNLLQQQQQQQQQQFMQSLSPTKPKDNSSFSNAVNTINHNNLNFATTTPARAQPAKQQKVQQQQQQLQQNQRTQKRQNSQNTNCSSSRSCSPNSNSSPIQNNNSLVPQHQQQQQPMLLLNSLTPFTQLMLQQQQQQQQQLTTPSNLLLTPATPNSIESKSTILSSDYMLGNSTGAAVGPSCLSSGLPFANYNFQHTTPNVANISFTAQNFLQSSTVTSTPTDEKTPKFAIEVDGDYANVDDGGSDAHEDDHNSNIRPNVDSNAAQQCEQQLRLTTNDDRLGVDGFVDEEANDELFSLSAKNRAKNTGNVGFDEDDIPLSILQTSSSGVVSSCTTSGESSAKLLHSSSGVNTLESSAATMDETSTLDSAIHMPYTPIKQEADSSLSGATTAKQALSLCHKQAQSATQQTILNNIKDESNMTPLALAANAMLTPPSSEQILVKSYESPGTTPSNLSLNKASSLDAFLPSGESLKNLKKYGSYLECENPLCRQENLREHFHCFDEPCKGKILGKKDDIIRHFKWHKKRIESLKLGFARFSKFDDCVPEYGDNCAYHMKQTHYHCIYESCKKNYVSTSDVQMHANFHRKDMEIVKEGFQRFRAHENCKTETCQYFEKGESHYHCCREGCNHTFKNKADMDKHKSQHQKAYQMKEDGFTKVLKTEICPFEGCRHPNNEPNIAVTHIHCLREGCTFICNPSSSQMISHKRKHDREDGEQAYQQFKKQQKELSEDESPTTTQQLQQQQQQNAATNNVSTPLSSHSSTEQFLSRKRGRPPKMIQLPADSSCDSKRFKLETQNEFSQQQQQHPTQYQQQQQQLLSLSNSLSSASNMFSPFLPNLNVAATTAAMQQSLQAQDPSASANFQMTHLMALFQLQNPLFYQNLYPGMLAAGVLPQNASMLGNFAALNAAAAAAAVTAPHVKSEFNDKQQFKE